MKMFALRVECCVCLTNNKAASEREVDSIQNFQQATFKMSAGIRRLKGDRFYSREEDTDEVSGGETDRADGGRAITNFCVFTGA